MDGNNDVNSPENKFVGMFRAKVVEVDCEENGEKNCYGGIRVFVPDIHGSGVNPDIKEKDSGIMAYPGNSSVGGYNEDDTDKTSFYASSLIVPLPGSYVNVYFEGGNIDSCFYQSAFQAKLCKVPPENRGVDEPHKVYTLLKSGQGRTIVICDSSDQARVEITGKKRKLDNSEGPQGNSSSVYEIDDNQTTILLDERDGKEKLLIRSHKGDFINFDIENRKLQISMKSDIDIFTEGRLTLDAKQGIDIRTTAGDIMLQAKNAFNLLCDAAINLFSKSTISLKSKSTVSTDGSQTLIQCGVSQSASAASPNTPKGDR